MKRSCRSTPHTKRVDLQNLLLPSKRSRKIPEPKAGAENEAIEADDDDLDDDIALDATPEKEAKEDKA